MGKAYKAKTREATSAGIGDSQVRRQGIVGTGTRGTSPQSSIAFTTRAGSSQMLSLAKPKMYGLAELWVNRACLWGTRGRNTRRSGPRCPGWLSLGKNKGGGARGPGTRSQCEGTNWQRPFQNTIVGMKLDEQQGH